MLKPSVSLLEPMHLFEPDIYMDEQVDVLPSKNQKLCVSLINHS